MLINIEYDRTKNRSQDTRSQYYKALEEKHFDNTRLFEINIFDGETCIGGAKLELSKSISEEPRVRKLWRLESELSGISISDLWAKSKRSAHVLPMLLSLIYDIGDEADLYFSVLSLSPNFASLNLWPKASLAEPHIDFNPALNYIYNKPIDDEDELFVTCKELGAKVLGRPSVCPISRTIKVLMAQKKDLLLPERTKKF